MNGRRGFLAALVGLAVCPQGPATARPPVLARGGWVVGPHNSRVMLHGGEHVIPAGTYSRDGLQRAINAFYRPARRPIEVKA
jgi:hypothetical protein